MSRRPRLIILGRDGVINEPSDTDICSPDTWVPIPGSLEAIARLNHAGFIVAIATNQAGISNGRLTLDDLNRVHGRLHTALARVGGHVDAIFFCPHTVHMGCQCHKPSPGLLRSISLRFGTPLNGVPVVGDTLADVAAAYAVRATPFLVLSGLGRKTLAEQPELGRIPCFADLSAVVDALFEGQGYA